MANSRKPVPLNPLQLSIQEILDAVPFYVLLIDENHNILAANRAVTKYLGVRPENILGGYCPTVIHGLQHPFPGCPLEEAAEKEQAVDRELFDDTSGRWVVSSVYPTGAVTRDGKKIYLHMVTDITERKQAQEQLKITHEQLRRISAHLESVREEEKREIARNLHDEASQLLASLYTHLEAAIGMIDSDPFKTRQLLRKSQTMATTVLDEIHNLIHDLRPAALDELGLVPAVSNLAEKHLKSTGIKVTLKTTGKVRRLVPALEIAIFRIIQESFSNIARHAHAKNTLVSIHFRKACINVAIQDDGTGFSVKEVMNSRDKFRGLGLLGIRERVDLMNGTLKIDSSPGYGTQVTIEVPLDITEKSNG